MSDRHHDDPPSPFIVEWMSKLPAHSYLGGRALDVAMGRGRHLELLARGGYRVFGVDWQIDVVSAAVRRAAAAGLGVRAWVADLTCHPLPAAAFDLLVVTRYLERGLFGALGQALAPEGVILYETFTEAQRDLGWGPRSPDHLLKPGELRNAFEDLDVLFYEEVGEPAAVARLAGRRRDFSVAKRSAGSDTLPGRSAP
jgi:tellurite methyltransferase